MTARGGKRPGAGRKPAQKPPEAPPVVITDEKDPLTFLTGVMQGTIEATPLQVRAAIAAAQYVHTKTHDGGKKDAKVDAAKQASKGRFSAAPPPLKLVGSKR